jgi:PAS domain S-box-containing protein
LPAASPFPPVRDLRLGLSPMGEVLSWDAAAQAFTGYATDEIIGRNIESIIPEPHAATARTAFAALRGGGSARFEALLRRKDGALVEIEIDAKPLPDGPGATRIAAVIRDLTSSRRAGRQIEERLRLALCAAGIGTYEIDLATGRYALDARAAAAWGRAADEALCYQTLASQVLDEDRPRVKSALDAASDAKSAGDGAYAAEFRIRRHNDGALRWLSLQGRAFFEDGRAVNRVGVMLDITDKKNAQAQLEQAHARMAQQTAELDAIFEALNVPVTVYNRDGEIVRTNAAARAVWGISPDIQSPIDFQHLAATLSVRDGAGETIDPAALSARRALGGEVVTGEEFQITSPSGLRYDFNAAELPLVVAGEITGAVSVWRDVTDHKRKDEQATILLRELSHRSKNLLSVIESILRQSAKSSGSKEDFVARFSERLHALANAHDLLARNNSLSVSMTDLIFSQVGHHWEPGQRRISMSGLGVRLKPDAAQMIGMALHELSTNAAKYGALSNQTGRVSISWKIDLEDEDEPAFQLKWIERGGPPVTAPEHRGFGTTVIQRVAGQSLRGSATLDYFAEGVVWVLRAPRSAVLDNIHADSPRGERGERMRSGALEKLQDAWVGLQRDGRLPRLAEMPLAASALRDNLIVAEVDHRESPPRVRFASVGKGLTERLGPQFEGQEIELTEAEIIGTPDGAYRRCLRSAKPGYEYAHFNLGQGRSFFFERLLLPLSEDGQTITHIVGMASFEDGLPAKPPR